LTTEDLITTERVYGASSDHLSAALAAPVDAPQGFGLASQQVRGGPAADQYATRGIPVTFQITAQLKKTVPRNLLLCGGDTLTTTIIQ
jgi:hypothetical protein